MKQISLISILSAYRHLDNNVFEQYQNYYSIKLRDAELDDLRPLVQDLLKISKRHFLFDKYFIGYKIPQIGKEFDLLRIDSKSVVNIELKVTSTEEKIRKQLIKNKYYLEFLDRDMSLFTYVSDTAKLYQLDARNDLVESDVATLYNTLERQDEETITDIDSLFKPSNYLVSPFNSTEIFVSGKYFLTTHQDEIKSSIKGIFSTKSFSIVALTGGPGTGKTLMTYDLAKMYSDSHRVLIIHCGILNDGQNTLIEKYDWDIKPIKVIWEKFDFSKYDIIVVDETQRILPNQFDRIIEAVKIHKIKCVLSYDSRQTLRKGEASANIAAKIDNCRTHQLFSLTKKIRTNAEVANFIRCLFDKTKQPDRSIGYSNIEITYFKSVDTTKKYLTYIADCGWTIIQYTSSASTMYTSATTYSYDEYKVTGVSANAHKVIGQEFDNVVAVIDKDFYYKDNALAYNNRSYYGLPEMLYQILSRARIKVQIVLIDNQEVLQRCLQIVH